MSRIVIIASFTDALVNFRGALIRDLISKGHEVIALGPNHSEETIEKLQHMGAKFELIKLNRRGMNPLSDLGTLMNLYRTLKRLKPDITFSFTIKPVLYGSLAAWMAGTKNITSMITGIGTMFSRNSFSTKIINCFLRPLYKLALSKNQTIYFQNPDDRDLFKSLRLISNTHNITITNGSGVDIDHFQPVPFPNTIAFLLIGRIIKEKGIFEYIDAARLIKNSYPDITFNLAGWYDEESTEIRNYVNQAMEDKTINFLGELKDVRPAIEKCSVYVLPSYAEGTPRTVLEAMAMGRPVITTDVPGCRQTVVDGKNGYLVKSKDSSILADAMLRFINQPNLIKEMSPKSREIAQVKYDVSKVNSTIMEAMNL